MLPPHSWLDAWHLATFPLLSKLGLQDLTHIAWAAGRWQLLGGARSPHAAWEARLAGCVSEVVTRIAATRAHSHRDWRVGYRGAASSAHGGGSSELAHPHTLTSLLWSASALRLRLAAGARNALMSTPAESC